MLQIWVDCAPYFSDLLHTTHSHGSLDKLLIIAFFSDFDIYTQYVCIQQLLVLMQAKY